MLAVVARVEFFKLQITVLSREVCMRYLSALVEQVAGPEGGAPRELAYYLPVLDHLWNEFGEDRLIYGSNWPVSDRGAPYEVVFGLVREFFAGKGEEAMEKDFWKNALVAYGVK